MRKVELWLWRALIVMLFIVFTARWFGWFPWVLA